MTQRGKGRRPCGGFRNIVVHHIHPDPVRDAHDFGGKVLGSVIDSSFGPQQLGEIHPVVRPRARDHPRPHFDRHPNSAASKPAGCAHYQDPLARLDTRFVHEELQCRGIMAQDRRRFGEGKFGRHRKHVDRRCNHIFSITAPSVDTDMRAGAAICFVAIGAVAALAAGDPREHDHPVA